jgi:hypothetical protein
MKMSECECDKAVCPVHEGHFDCHSFCEICEGNQEYCITHDEWETEKAITYLQERAEERMEKTMLQEHREELAILENELHTKSLSRFAIACIEGRISDLDSMIAQDEYWEKQEKKYA